jgi:hypothetical protein
MVWILTVVPNDEPCLVHPYSLVIYFSVYFELIFWYVLRHYTAVFRQLQTFRDLDVFGAVWVAFFVFPIEADIWQADKDRRYLCERAPERCAILPKAPIAIWKRYRDYWAIFCIWSQEFLVRSQSCSSKNAGTAHLKLRATLKLPAHNKSSLILGNEKVHDTTYPKRRFPRFSWSRFSIFLCKSSNCRCWYVYSFRIGSPWGSRRTSESSATKL